MNGEPSNTEARLKIHEQTSATGELLPVYLAVRTGELEIEVDGVARLLPSGALGAVLARYGAPFDASERIVEVARLQLGNDELLRHVRHLAGYDVIARDYLVYEVSGSDGQCALAAQVTAALLFLARAAGGN